MEIRSDVDENTSAGLKRRTYNYRVVHGQRRHCFGHAWTLQCWTKGKKATTCIVGFFRKNALPVCALLPLCWKVISVTLRIALWVPIKCNVLKISDTCLMKTLSVNKAVVRFWSWEEVADTSFSKTTPGRWFYWSIDQTVSRSECVTANKSKVVYFY